LISVVDTRDQRGSGWSFQNAAPEHPRTVRQWMVRFDFASLDGQAECARTDGKHVGGAGSGTPRCGEHLGEVLKFYYREAA
jgi:hypothetical protein